MRTIKFRAWDIDSSEMLYSETDNYKEFFFELSNTLNLMMPIAEDFPETRKSEIMQFTGLKDHNGKEIYEGDVILGYTHPHQVIFADGAYYLQYKQSSIRLSRTCGKLEVIGNIHENTELLSFPTAVL